MGDHGHANIPLIATITDILDWVGLIAFAATGALAASRKQMDVVGFALLASAVGIGGGTMRDVMLGLLPVFWVKEPAYLLVCISVACVLFFTAHFPQSRLRWLLWLDAIGLALFAVSGADKALAIGAAPTVAVAMGVVTATFGGIIRDVLAGETPVILSREIYVSAALVGALVFVLLSIVAAPRDVAMAAGFLAGLALRAAALLVVAALQATAPATTAGLMSVTAHVAHGC
jgi:uncharacterized membrane protein YeiH